ncbi:MAG: hypothetical protein IIZ92_21975, partial [Aquincola sp.]|nr:hypothetical protein [Aquincola sp.]
MSHRFSLGTLRREWYCLHQGLRSRFPSENTLQSPLSTPFAAPLHHQGASKKSSRPASATVR